METEKIVKSTQEQAIASWVNYLNQVRLDRLVDRLKDINHDQELKILNQAQNFKSALSSIDEALENVNRIIETGRGGTKGLHGFIAETSQVGFGNAKSQVLGGKKIYQWVDDNGQWDIVRHIADNGLKETPIQMKFVQSSLSLDALLEHLEAYPDSLKVGGKYQIPKDYYEIIVKYLNTPFDVANKMPTQNSEFSFRTWKKVNEIVNKKIPLDCIEPSDFTYREVQYGKIHDTMTSKKNSIKEINDEQNQKIKDEAKKKSKEAYDSSKPSFSEGAKATAISAAVEGTTAFCIAIYKKRKSGKKLFEFNEDDWKEIGGESAIGALKGGIRGVSIYTLTNYTATPAAVASALTTSSFGIAEQINLYRKGKLTEIELIENSEMLCLDTAVSAFSSFAGQVMIPVPVLGAIIGNAVGSMLYQIAKVSFNENEQKILRSYINDIEIFENNLNEEYAQYVILLNEEFMKFMGLVHNAYSPDINKAFDGSIQLALSLGLEEEKILKTINEINNYFFD